MTTRRRPLAVRMQALPRLVSWLRAVGFTLVMSVLVAWGVGDESDMLAFAVVGTAGLGLGVLYWLFPRGLHFAFGAAAGLALYTSIFVVLSNAQFPDAPDWARPAAFLLPVVAFLVVAWFRRDEIGKISELAEVHDLDKLPHNARWLIFTALVGLVCFVLPVNRMVSQGQGWALLIAMSCISAVVALAARDVVRLLIDVSLIVEEMGTRVRHLLVPATAFLLMYALLVVGFASAYRIADELSRQELFSGPEGPIRISYSDSLHFSVATLSTVGYGDIRPQDDGIRVLSSMQVVAGQLLLLFGFAEIMRARRTRTPSEDRHRGRDGGTPPGD